jgi:hypothetical protein
LNQGPIKEAEMADVKDEGLVSLDGGGWSVAEGEPDVRGWDVLTAGAQAVAREDSEHG